MKWIAGLLGIAGVGLGTLASCGADEVCAPGLQQACACPGSEVGAQACNAEGTGFEECICAPGPGGDGGGGNGGGGDGGGGVTGPDCVERCEEAKQCEGANPSLDCEANCANAKADATSLGCLAEYETLLECVVSVDDVCNPGDECSVQAGAYGDCFVEACTSNPDQPACNA